jgi:hypothetical protein
MDDVRAYLKGLVNLHEAAAHAIGSLARRLSS